MPREFILVNPERNSAHCQLCLKLINTTSKLGHSKCTFRNQMFSTGISPYPPTAPPLSCRPSWADAPPRQLRRATAEAVLRRLPRRGRAENNGIPLTPGLRRGGSPAVFEVRPHPGRWKTSNAEPPPGPFSGCFYSVATSRVPVTFPRGAVAETALRLPSRR